MTLDLHSLNLCFSKVNEMIYFICTVYSVYCTLQACGLGFMLQKHQVNQKKIQYFTNTVVGDVKQYSEDDFLF